jgi:hypothetical protein
MIAAPWLSTAVVFVADVATSVAVLAIEPTSLHDSVRLGKVLLTEPGVVIACDHDILYAAGAVGVTIVSGAPALKFAVNAGFKLVNTEDAPEATYAETFPEPSVWKVARVEPLGAAGVVLLRLIAI